MAIGLGEAGRVCAAHVNYPHAMSQGMMPEQYLRKFLGKR